MDFVAVVILLACVLMVSATVPGEEFHVPQPYSFGYAIKDKHGEQHRQEISDGLHNVKGSYGFKDERGIERQVNYVADEGGFRAEVKTNEPGTAPLNPAAVKMESSAHPYFGVPKPPVAAGTPKDLPFFGGFEWPGILKLKEAELAKNGLAFDAGLAKENEFEKEALNAGLAKAFESEIGLEKLAKEGYGISPLLAQGLVKEAEAAKGLGIPLGFGLEELLKKGYALIPVDLLAAKEAELKKEGIAIGSEELAKLGFASSPFFAKKYPAFGLKEAELEKESFNLEKFRKAFPFAPKAVEAPLPFFAPAPYAAVKPKGFAYGGPVLGGFVKSYDARLY